MAQGRTSRGGTGRAGGRSQGRAGRAGGTPEDAVAQRIAELDGPDRRLAERVHAIITETAPELRPRTWYGMPAYAKDGEVVCFFQAGSKFGTRYATLGFTDAAGLDDGDMWPVAYAIATLTPAVERRIAELVRRAVGRAG